MRRLLIATAMLVTAAAGIASASVVTAGSADPPSPGMREPVDAPPGQVGETSPDPRGGPLWAVRTTSAVENLRCVSVGRTDGNAFGPVDAQGRIRDTGPSYSGSCADPAAEPLQVALARYGDTAGTGPRTVLFGVADASVKSVTVEEPKGIEPITPGPDGTFVVVREGMARDEAWRVIATLDDGTQRIYPL